MPYTEDNSPIPPDAGQTNNSAANFPAPNHGHAIALAVTLATVAVLLIVIITYFTIRMRRAKSDLEQGRGSNINTSALRNSILDPRHPASHITPYSMREPYRSKMRIALRRQDGAWDFADPESPFTPSGVADPVPSPVSPSTSMRSTVRIHVTEERQKRNRGRDTGTRNVRELEPPPPAYRPEDHPDEGITDGKH